jgi:hypothetical protein
MNDVAIRDLKLSDDGSTLTFERERFDYEAGEYMVKLYSVDLKSAKLSEKREDG